MTLVLAAVAGVALGVLHVAALLWNVRLYLAGARGRAIALHALRLAGVIAVMWLGVRQGAGPLLAGAAGFLAATFAAARAGVR